MTDRETIMKALEHHKETAVCNGCPYADRADTAEGYCPIYDDAIAMLREKEPFEPKPTGIEPNYNCGACGLPITNGYPFCPWCGRKVKWDD